MTLFAIDICNTIADVLSQIELALGPTPYPTQYFHPRIYEGFFDENQWVFSNAPVFNGAVESINFLSTLGKIIYLTARPRWSNQITRTWLAKHGFPEAPVIHTNNKLEVAQSLGVSLAVEDAPHEIDSLSKICPVLVHARPYNVGYLGRFSWESFIKSLSA